MEHGPALLEHREVHSPLTTRVVSVHFLSPLRRTLIENLSRNAEHVKYNSEFSDITAQGQLGNPRAIISSVSEDNKCSYGFRNCIGIAMAGNDVRRGKRLSFLAHINPNEALQRDFFFTDAMQPTLEKFMARVRQCSIEAGIFGGIKSKTLSMVDERRKRGKTWVDDYRDVAGKIARDVARHTGKIPCIIQHPHDDIYEVDAFLDTKKAALTLLAWTRYTYAVVRQDGV